MISEKFDLNEGVVLGLVATEAPELRVERQRVRGLEVVTQLLLFGSSIGAFSTHMNPASTTRFTLASRSIFTKSCSTWGSSLVRYFPGGR